MTDTAYEKRLKAFAERHGLAYHEDPRPDAGMDPGSYEGRLAEFAQRRGLEYRPDPRQTAHTRLSDSDRRVESYREGFDNLAEHVRDGGNQVREATPTPVHASERLCPNGVTLLFDDRGYEVGCRMPAGELLSREVLELVRDEGDRERLREGIRFGMLSDADGTPAPDGYASHEAKQRHWADTYGRLIGLTGDIDRMREARGGAPVGERILEAYTGDATNGTEPGTYRIRILSAGRTRDGKRYYTPEALQTAARDRVYDGAKMFVGHSDPRQEQARGHRDLREWAATIVPGSVAYDPGSASLTADCRVTDAQVLAWLRDPVSRREVGLSHDSFVQAAQETAPDGKPAQVVHRIARANSVDFVPMGNAAGDGPVIG